MKVEVKEEPPIALEAYATIPIAFEVTEILDVAEQKNHLGELVLRERSIETPYLKDYDAIEGEAPTHWPRRFDISTWGILAARVDGRRVGGAAVAFKTPGLDMLEGREDLAVLWDIRVSPEARGQGVGATLFRAAESWARGKGCRQLKIETQNTNVPACRFYARQGCIFTAVNRFAYPSLPDEIQLLWYKSISNSSPPGS